MNSLIILGLGFCTSLLLNSSTARDSNIGYNLYPVLMHGTRRVSSVSKLRCPSLSESLARVKRFNLRLATAEPRTRIGYLCTGVDSNIKCSSSVLEYQTASHKSLVTPSKGSCELMVSKFSHGHIAGFKETTPDCAMGYTSERNDHQLIIKRLILPFSPSKNGVTSKLFRDSVCTERYCPSHDGKSHWFLETSETPGCAGLIDGVGEMKMSTVGRNGSILLSTNVIGDTPLREICQTDDYCGLPTYIDSAFNGFSVQSLEGDVGEILSHHVRVCKTGGSIREYSGNDIKALMPLTDIMRHRHYKCQEVLNKGVKDGFISERFLTLFQPYQEGIAPGYRYENGELWEYDLYYLLGLFRAQSFGGEGHKTYKWDVIDAGGSPVTMHPSLCIYNTTFENSATGPLCSWFNGLQIQGVNIYYPDVSNHFEYSREYPVIPYYGTIANEENQHGGEFFGPGIWIKSIPRWAESLIWVLCGVIFLVLIFYIFRCAIYWIKYGRQVDDDSIKGGNVEITELQTIRPIMLGGRQPLAIGWNQEPCPPATNQAAMLEWFE